MLRSPRRFDTTSRDGNLPLIDFVEDYLDGWAFRISRVDYEAGRKTNLYATIGPEWPGGIVLSGHTDVVPVDGQDWASDPFKLNERDGRLYGRGTCDMKGFIAVALAMVPEFKAANLKTPIHLALSCDEEVGCRGVRPLVAHMRDHLPKPRAVIVGEPTSMQVVNAHKGAVTFSTEVTGHEAHSSCTHLGVNAIMVAGELLGETQPHPRRHPRARRSPPALRSALYDRACRPHRRRHRQEHHPAPLRLPVGDAACCRLADPERGAQRASILLRARLEPAMKQVADDAGIATEQINVVPCLAPEDNSPAEHLALHLAGANGTHAVSYCTEAGPLPGDRHSRHRLRARLDRAGPQARRISRHFPSCEMRDLYAAAAAPLPLVSGFEPFRVKR